MNLKGKVAIVTGGVSGIGRATLKKLAEQGARVVCADINADAGAVLVNEAETLGLSVDFLQVDLADRASILEFARRLPEMTGNRLDVLVNAAGWDIPMPFLDNKPDFVDKVMWINLLGPLTLTQALLPMMIEQNSGKIVNVASDAGRVGSSGETTYAAAKGGLIAFTKSLAREVARNNINVNCVCPGPTDTPFFNSASEKLREAITRAIPLKRIAKPEEVREAIVFFAGDGANYMTGQVVSVSGGLTMSG